MYLSATMTEATQYLGLPTTEPKLLCTHTHTHTHTGEAELDTSRHMYRHDFGAYMCHVRTHTHTYTRTYTRTHARTHAHELTD